MSLHPDELECVFGRSEVIISAEVNHQSQSIILVCGDLRVVTVPFSIFEPSGDGITPDFTKVYITDYGRTLALGEYEAAVDTIL